MLVVAQVAVSLVLLIVGGLFVRTLERARSVDLGIRVDRVLLTTVDLPRLTYPAEARAAYYRNARGRVAALPGVSAAAWISGPPFSFEQDQEAVQRADRPRPADGQGHSTLSIRVTPEYFQAARVAILEGRGFDDRDVDDARPVTIVNETLARQLWPGESPLGKHLRMPQVAEPVEVVGIAKDGRYILLWEAPRPLLFLPLAQAASGVCDSRSRCSGCSPPTSPPPCSRRSERSTRTFRPTVFRRWPTISSVGTRF